MANSYLGVAHDVVKSNVSNDSFDWFLVVTTAGTVVIDHLGGNTTTLTKVPLGVWIPCANAINIRTTSTAVDIMVV